jgi:hypothetical protein
MDAALTNPTGRKFPSMTTVDLKCAVVDFQMGIDPNQKYMTVQQVEEKIAAMVEEVRRREAGISKTLHQVLGR